MFHGMTDDCCDSELLDRIKSGETLGDIAEDNERMMRVVNRNWNEANVLQSHIRMKNNNREYKRRRLDWDTEPLPWERKCLKELEAEPHYRHILWHPSNTKGRKANPNSKEIHLPNIKIEKAENTEMCLIFKERKTHHIIILREWNENKMGCSPDRNAL